MNDPYVECPALETQSFILRLVSENDVEDLLYCYSDPRSQDIFNSDKCTSGWNKPDGENYYGRVKLKRINIRE